MTTIFDKKTIGDLILAYRKRNHLRREILAKQLDVKPETVRNWENGDTKPSLLFSDHFARQEADTTCSGM